MLLPAVSAWPRWSTAAATWRFDSTASTCLRLTAAIRTSGWWLSAIRSRPAPSLRSNCTATCSCSEPVWTWSSSSSTHGMSAHRLQLLLTGQRRVRRLALSWSLSFYRIVFKHEWPAWDVKARPERTFGFFWVFRRGREWSLCAWAWLTAGCSYIEHNLWFHQLGQRAPCVTVGMMFFSWHAVLYHMYGDSDLLFCFPQSLGDHQNVFVECLCCWSAQSLPYSSPTDANNWGKWGLLFFRCCSGFVVTSWSHGCVLRVILIGQTLLGSSTVVPSFLHMWIQRLSLELQSWLCGAFQTQRCHWLCFLRPQLSVLSHMCGSNPAPQNDLNFPINGVDHS